MGNIISGLPRKPDYSDTGILPELNIGFNEKTTIQVSRSVRDALQKIARQIGVRSFDEVLKSLVSDYEKEHKYPNLMFMSDLSVPTYEPYVTPPRYDTHIPSYPVNLEPQWPSNIVMKPIEKRVEIRETKVHVVKSSVQIGGNSYIDFTYYHIEKGLSDSTMNIQITGVVFNGRRVDSREFMKEQANPLVLYFKVVEKVIQLECDPRFELPKGNALGKTFQLDYWNGIFSAYQLPKESLRKDIQEKIERFTHGKAVFT